jgi:hypothetical protein
MRYQPTLYRFWDKIQCPDGPDGCWLWTGGKADHGYGTFWFNGRLTRAHRFAWTTFCGVIPAGSLVLHRCDTPACVNPSHLFLGSQSDNMTDCSTKGRVARFNALKTHCPQGHSYSEANTYVTRQGTRRCRTCDRIRRKVLHRRAALAALDRVREGEGK